MISRSQVRRAQRKHSALCFRSGALLKVHHQNELDHTAALAGSPEALVLLHSIGIHRADCDALQREVHFAAISNVHSRDCGFKSNSSFILHRALHRSANLVKHDVVLCPPPPPPPLACAASEDDLLLPPPPPPLVEVPFSGCPLDADCAFLADPAIMMAFRTHDVGIMHAPGYIPFSGASWNVCAEPFVPQQSVSCAFAPASTRPATVSCIEMNFDDFVFDLDESDLEDMVGASFDAHHVPVHESDLAEDSVGASFDAHHVSVYTMKRYRFRRQSHPVTAPIPSFVYDDAFHGLVQDCVLQLLYMNTHVADKVGISTADLGTNLTSLLQSHFGVEAPLAPSALHDALGRLTDTMLVVNTCDGFHYKLSQAGRLWFQEHYDSADVDG